jgi:hypothetical protein
MMAVNFFFVMRSGPVPGLVIPLEGLEISVGREVDCTLVINDSEVSRKHFHMTWQENSYWITDDGSTNGTFVNGQRINTPCVLQPGDRISLGGTVTLSFENSHDPETNEQPFHDDAANHPDPGPGFDSHPPMLEDKIPAQTPKDHGSGQPDPLSAFRSIFTNLRRRTITILFFCLLFFFSIIAAYLFLAPLEFWCKTFPFLYTPGLYPQCLP